MTAALVAFVVTGSVGSVFYYQQRRLSRKRRAGRSASGARTEVVVIAGAVGSPVASTLALDLERRGYIVYAVASGAEDEHLVRSLQRIDLLPLPLDLVDPYAAADQMQRFRTLLEKEHLAFEEAEPHRLKLKGLILVPDSASVPSGAIGDISSEDWSDALNAKVLNTVATTQLFLPLLKEHAAKVLLLTPSVTSALLLPGHSVENTINGALASWTTTLRAELRSSGVSVTQFKLGSLDIPAVTARQRREGVPAPRLQPTPLRALHESVFDALAAKRPARTWYVGRGSLAYDIVGSIAPASVISWMVELGHHRTQKKVEAGVSSIEASSTWERVERDSATA